MLTAPPDEVSAPVLLIPARVLAPVTPRVEPKVVAPVALSVPEISSKYPGFVVPMPMLPFKAVVVIESLPRVMELEPIPVAL